MMFRACSGRVPDTRNTGNRCGAIDFDNVPGVTGLCARVHVTTCAHIAHAHIKLFSTRVHKEHTEHWKHRSGTRLSGVTGTRNINHGTRNMQNNKPLRQTMPTVAAWIDELRDAFGTDMVNDAIRAGMDGQPTFFARENGHEVGTRAPYSADRSVSGADVHLGTFNSTAAHRDGRKGKN